MSTHCGTHIETFNHLGFYGKFWNGWTADKDLGSRIWNKGGLEKYPPVIARGVLVDVAGMHGVTCLPDSYAITPDDLKDRLRRGRGAPRRRRLRRRPHVRLAGLRRLPGRHSGSTSTPRSTSARASAMCIAGDSIGLEVMPSPGPTRSCQCTATCSGRGR
jgi:hypothetical protein